MTAREMQLAVEIELRQRDPNYEIKNKLQSDEIFYFLSRAEMDYVQEIYQSGIDKNEENRRKLGALLRFVTINSGSDITSNAFYSHGNFNTAYNVVVPTETLYTINERCKFTINSVVYNNVFIKPISFDEYSVNKENPFRKPTLDKVLRMESIATHILLLPYGSVLNNVYLDYITTPTGIFISSDESGDCQLQESVHYNIIRSAVKLILGAKQEQVGYNIQSIEEKQNN